VRGGSWRAGGTNPQLRVANRVNQGVPLRYGATRDRPSLAILVSPPVSVDTLPVGKQPVNVLTQQVGGQVGHANEGQNQEPRVVDDRVEILLPQGVRPADKSIPAGDFPGGRAPGEADDGALAGIHKILQVFPYGLAVPEGMVACDQAVEQGLLGPASTDLEPAQRQELFQRGCNRGAVDGQLLDACLPAPVDPVSLSASVVCPRYVTAAFMGHCIAQGRYERQSFLQENTPRGKSAAFG